MSTLKKQCPGFAAMRKLVLSFRGILRRGKVGTLKRWIKEAENSGITGIARFRQALKERSGGRGKCGGVWLEQRSCRRTYQPLESCEEANVRESRIRAASITSSPLGGLNEPAPNLRKNQFKGFLRNFGAASNAGFPSYGFGTVTATLLLIPRANLHDPSPWRLRMLIPLPCS